MFLLVCFGYALCVITFVAAVIKALLLFDASCERGFKFVSKQTGVRLLAIALLASLGASGVYALNHRNVPHDKTAVAILEDRYDITVNVVGDYRTKAVTDWTINGRSRDCYVTVAGFNNIDTADLLCKDYTTEQVWVEASAL